MLKLLSKNKKILIVSILSFVGGIIATSASHVLEKYIDAIFFNTTEKQYKISDTTKYFPLEKENKWTYEGIYKGTYSNSNKTYSKNIVFTIKVAEVHEFKGITSSNYEKEYI